eukprot:12193577-Heterocapsa_arctica.AAC.1
MACDIWIGQLKHTSVARAGDRWIIGLLKHRSSALAGERWIIGQLRQGRWPSSSRSTGWTGLLTE